MDFDTSRMADMEVSITLQDSAGLINFFKIDRGLLKNFFRHRGIEDSRGDVIVDSIADWLDADDFPRPSGAEKSYYLDASSYLPANRLIDSIEELRVIRGIDEEVYGKIKDCLDFTVRNHGLNPNTMPRRVFRLFPGLTDERIGLIIGKRREMEIDSLAAFTLMSGYNFSAYPDTFQFFTSNTTYVKIRAKMSEDRYFYMTTRFSRAGARGALAGDRFRRSLGARGRGGPGAEGLRSLFRIRDRYRGTEKEEAPPGGGVTGNPGRGGSR
jgi:type II secretory pathway component PulK